MKAAIYSRKSKFTGKGESIENQVQLCIDHCKKIGIEDFIIYEDEGFSGKSTDRPQFKKMMKDAKEKKYDYLVCYRLDRVSRNVSDFSYLIEQLNKLEISFISIKEQFDTSTPMGRAMMYISSVFAQLERETIAERVRDNMYELARTGRWLGGIPPYGFNSKEIVYIDENMTQRKMYQLDINEEDMELVKIMFEKYLEKKTLTYVFRYLEKNGIRGKRGGIIDQKSISNILKNPAYVKADTKVVEYLKSNGLNVVGDVDSRHGILVYGKNSNDTVAAVARHTGIIDSTSWLEVQRQIHDNREKGPRVGTGNKAILSGLLKCSKCNSNMRVTYKNSNESCIYYYTCGKKKKLGASYCDCKNVRADILEEEIINRIKSENINSIVEKYKEIKTEHAKSNDKMDTKIKHLSSLIKDKEGLVDTLIMQLARITESNASKLIVDKIETINNEILQLKNELDNLGTSSSALSMLDLDIDIVIQNLNTFNSEIDFADIDRKRLLLQTIVDDIIWDGDNETAVINYQGLKKKLK